MREPEAGARRLMRIMGLRAIYRSPGAGASSLSLPIEEPQGLCTKSRISHRLLVQSPHFWFRPYLWFKCPSLEVWYHGHNKRGLREVRLR